MRDHQQAAHHHAADPRPGHDHHAADGGTDAGLVEMLDLDGQVLGSYWSQVLGWLGSAAADTAGGRILDLGAGSGVGTIALAQRFDSVEIVAVDAAAEMLRRIEVKALEQGLSDRIRTVQADLNLDWPDLGPVDITWASMSLHHLADPDRALREVFAATRPGGLLAVAEVAEPLRFLPDDLGLGWPGLQTRCLDALRIEHAQLLPDLGSEWPPRLAAAGFTLLSERSVAIELDPPHPPEVARYAELWLGRLRSGAADQLAPDDLETLAVLLDGDGAASVRRRGDLQVRGTRTLTLARRP